MLELRVISITFFQLLCILLNHFHWALLPLQAENKMPKSKAIILKTFS